MIVLLAAVFGLLAGTVMGFMAVLALLKHFKWKTWAAMITALALSLPISVLVGGAAGAALILVMYPDFDWSF